MERLGHALKETTGKGDRKWRDACGTGRLVVLEVWVGCRAFRGNHCEIKQMANPQRPGSRKNGSATGHNILCHFTYLLRCFYVNHFQSPHGICLNTDSIFMPWLLGHKAYRSPASWRGIELASQHRPHCQAESQPLDHHRSSTVSFQMFEMFIFKVFLICSLNISPDAHESCSVVSNSWETPRTRTLEWVAIPFSRGSSWFRDWAWVSLIAGRFFTIWATWKAQRLGREYAKKIF